MAQYQMDETRSDLNALKKRLETTDLVPSQMVLLEGLSDKIAAFQKAGLSNLADLRAALKSQEARSFVRTDRHPSGLPANSQENAERIFPQTTSIARV